MKAITFFPIILALAAAAGSLGCGSRATESVGKITIERSTAFRGPELDWFKTLEDGTRVTLNTARDGIATTSQPSPIPGHQARSWILLRDAEIGTSLAYGLVSWNGDDPADYLMVGWWAQFPDQHPPDLDLDDSERSAFWDGAEIDPGSPPELPLGGQATYMGPAGGLYTRGTREDKVTEEFEGTITLTADFAEGMVNSCIGCVGDLVTRGAHFGYLLGEEVQDLAVEATDYEIRWGPASIDSNGSFVDRTVDVSHPERTVVESTGLWGGNLSNIPDEAGNPRLTAGAGLVRFRESDGSAGSFFNVFVALSDHFAASAP